MSMPVKKCRLADTNHKSLSPSPSTPSPSTLSPSTLSPSTPSPSTLSPSTLFSWPLSSHRSSAQGLEKEGCGEVDPCTVKEMSTARGGGSLAQRADDDVTPCTDDVTPCTDDVTPCTHVYNSSGAGGGIVGASSQTIAGPGRICAGSSLSDIYVGSCNSTTLPSLRSSCNHAVLFDAQHKPLSSGIPAPYPERFRDVWDSNHVKMPCSQRSLYPVALQGERDKVLQPRWDMIRQALSKPMNNSYDLVEAIITYNSRYSKKWNFSGLHAYFGKVCSAEESSDFFGTVLPRLVALALELPHVVTHAIPLLKKQQDYSVSLTQQQVACLLANAFLCTFPLRNSSSPTSEYFKFPSINFSALYSQDTADQLAITSAKANKLRCICHYLKRVTSHMPTGVLTFARRSLPEPPAWEHSTATFTKLHASAGGTIEENGHGMLQVDFANKYVGGGVLGSGCVQEEIRFLISPELILSRLLVEELDANEVLLVTGAETYSSYRGYGSNFEWSGDSVDSTARDGWARRQTTVVAMDALHFSSAQVQFRVGMMRRELNKAYCGFMPSAECRPMEGHRCTAVATGKWGCGVFRGHAKLKGLLQLMAAAQADRDVVYFTFGDKALMKSICSLHSCLEAHGCTICQVWQLLLKYRVMDGEDLYTFLYKELDKNTKFVIEDSTLEGNRTDR